jgi:hypothetical protein
MKEIAGDEIKQPPPPIASRLSPFAFSTVILLRITLYIYGKEHLHKNQAR